MKRFTAEQLRTFAAVVEHQTFEEAALELGVSASAVSQRIKAMEQACGQVLLQRTNPVCPTEPGQAVLRLARQIEQLTLETERELTGQDLQRTLTVAANADSLATWFLEALAQVGGAGIGASDVEGDSRILCEVLREDERHSSALLRTGAVTAVLTADPHPVQGCTVERLGTMRYWILASPAYREHHFGADGPTTSQLAAAPILQFDRKDDRMLEDMAAMIARAHGLPPQLQAPRVYIPGSAEYLGAVERGLGWGGVPEIQCEQALEEGRLVRLVPEPFDMPMFWQRWSLEVPALEKLTAAVRAAAASALRPSPRGLSV